MIGPIDIRLLGLPLAAEGGGDSSFLISPSVGLMIWTLVAFGVTLWLLNRYAFPQIAQALDRRRREIEESLERAERAKREADALVEEYRARLREAREQAEDILVRAQRAAEEEVDRAREEGRKQREELLAAARRDIEAETRRALDQIRREVAELTVEVTEKITRRSLTPDDHKRMIEDALRELDFAALAPQGGSAGEGATNASGR